MHFKQSNLMLLLVRFHVLLKIQNVSYGFAGLVMFLEVWKIIHFINLLEIRIHIFIEHLLITNLKNVYADVSCIMVICLYLVIQQIYLKTYMHQALPR